MIADFGAAVLPRLREVGNDFATEAVFPVISLQPEATPVSEYLLAAAKAWLQQGPVDRMAFYSDQERLETLGQQPRSSPPATAAEQNPADSQPPPKRPPRFPRKPKSDAK